MTQEPNPHVSSVSKHFLRSVDVAGRLFDPHDTETSNTLANVDVPGTASAMAHLIEPVLHSVAARYQLYSKLVEIYAGRVIKLEAIYEDELERREAARKNSETLRRGSLTSVISITAISYIGSLGVGVVLGGFMDEAMIASVRLPMAMNIARKVAQTADHLAGKMNLSPADAAAFIQKVTSEATAWHPTQLYESTTVLSLLLTCGIGLLQTHATFMAGGTLSKGSKLGFILADLGVGAALYFLRSPSLSSVNPIALAVALFDAAILLCTLFSAGAPASKVHKESECRRQYRDSLNAQQLGERYLASTDAELGLAIHKARGFAQGSDDLDAQSRMQSPDVAEVLKTGIRHTVASAKVEDEIRNDANVVRLFKEGLTRVSAHL